MRRNKELAILLTVASLQIVAPITVHAAQEELKASSETTSTSTEGTALTESVVSTQEDSIQTNGDIASTESEKAQSEENTNASDEQKEENSSETNSLDEETSEDMSSEEAVSNKDLSEEEQQNNQMSEAANEKQEEENTAASEAEKMESDETSSQVDNSENNEVISQSEDSQQTDADIQTAETNSDANSVSAKANSTLSDQETGDSESDNANEQKNGWVTENGKTYYYTNGEKVKDKVFEDNGQIYGVDNDGKRIENQEYSVDQYDESGNWIGNKIYYFDKEGHAVKGWYTNQNNDKYYYDENTGIAASGLKTIDGQKYYFWNNGLMAKNQTFEDGDAKKAYVVDNNGNVDELNLSQDGWKQPTSNKQDWYYVKDGRLLRNQVLSDDGNIYGLDYNGKMIKGEYSFWHYDESSQKGVNENYYFDENGHATKGWRTDENENKYYYDENTGIAAHGLKTIDEQKYCFTDNGRLMRNESFEDSDAKKVYLTDNDGHVTDELDLSQDGWKRSASGDQYYVKDGQLVKNQIISDDGNIYGFDYNGKMIKGEYSFWHADESSQKEVRESYYFDENGHAIKGWRTDENENKYYYDENTGIAAYGLKTIDGQKYYFDNNGRLMRSGLFEDSDVKKVYLTDNDGHVTDELDLSQDGWKRSTSGDQYYVKDGQLFKRQTLSESGNIYGFDDNGKMLKDRDADFGYYDTSSQTYIDRIYHFDKEGHAIKGWYTDQNENKYYYDENTGIAVHGLKTINGQKYYFTNYGRLMRNESFEDSDGKKAYVIDNDGHITDEFDLSQNGWKKSTSSDQDWYYIKDGQLVKNQILSDGGNIYGFDYNGKMIKDREADIRYYDTPSQNYIDRIYHFDKEGHAIKGWYTDQNENKYYYDENTGIAAYGLKTIDGQKYCFTNNGRLMRNESFEDSDAKKVYLTDNEGHVTDELDLSQDGWKRSASGDQYYVKNGQLLKRQTLSESDNIYGFDYNGKMIKDRDADFEFYDSSAQIYIDKFYRFDKEGHAVKGWYTDQNENKYYYDENTGIAAYGLKTIDGQKYCFTNNGRLMRNESFEDSDAKKVYLTDNEGHVTDELDLSQDGWKRSALGNQYYVKDGQLLKRQILSESGNIYGFDDNGKMIKDENWDFGHYDSSLQTYVDQYYRFDKEGHAIKGWYTDQNGNQYYYDENTGIAASGVKTVDGHTYYFLNGGSFIRSSTRMDHNTKKAYVADDNGYVTTLDLSTDGWRNVGDDHYYAKNGDLVKNSVITDNGAVYGFDYDGKMISDREFGFYNSDTKKYDRYYFNQDGKAAKGWRRNSRGQDYYYNEDSGIAASGLTTIDGEQYYFDESGSLAQNTVISDANIQKAYITDANGRVTETISLKENGWVKINDNDYYVQDGDFIKNKIFKDNGNIYGFDHSGKNLKDQDYEFYDPDTSRYDTYFFDTEGHAIQGWMKLYSDAYYYFDPITKAAVTGKNVIDGNTYFFDFNGRLKTNCTQTNDSSNTIYYLDHNGRAINQIDASEDGWHQIDGVWYYTKDHTLLKDTVKTIGGSIYGFDSDGVMVTDRSFYMDGHNYLFDENGVAVKGWYRSGATDGSWFYADPSTGIAVDGLQNINGKQYYFSDGYMQTDYLTDDGDNIYYFNSNGDLSETKKKPASGWAEVNNKWYYYENGNRIRNKIYEVNGNKYYFDSNGAMTVNQTQWYSTGNSHHYIRIDADGHLIKGWYSDKNGGWYYYDDNGYGVTGIQKINDNSYYFSDDGQMVTNSTSTLNDESNIAKIRTDSDGHIIEKLSTDTDGWKKFNNGWYLIRDHKVIKNKWEKSGNSWYYLGDDGKACNDGIRSVNDQDYYFDESGVMLQGWKLLNDVDWIYADANGHLAKGPTKIGDHIYYFGGEANDPFYNEYAMLSNTQRIAADGSLYDISSSGEATLQNNINGWVRIGSSYYWISNGKAQTGWQSIDNKWYYFDPDTYQMARNTTIGIDGKRYDVDSDGTLITSISYPTTVIDEQGNHLVTMAYIDPNGNSLKNGWVSLSGKWYYLKDGKAVTGTNYIDGKYSNFDISGAWIGYLSDIPTGWYLDPNTKQYYYFDKNHNMLKDTELYSEGNYYRFNENGVMLSDIEYQDQYYQSSGERLNNAWRQLLDGRWFYYNASGNKISSGFHKVNGTTYFFEGNNGIRMSTFVYENTLCTVNPNNGAITSITNLTSAGWIRADNAYYYYDGNSLVRNSIVEINGQKYCFDGEGKMLADEMSSYYSDAYHYFKPDGSMLIGGWYKSSTGQWYYADENGELADGLITLNGIQYYFGNGQYMRTSNSISDDGKTLYIIDTSGVVNDSKVASKDGWLNASGKWYYVRNGRFVEDDWVNDGGKEYAIGTDGTLFTSGDFLGYMVDSDGVKLESSYNGWLKNSAGNYYYVQNGEALSGDVEWQGQHYWMDDTIYTGIVDTTHGYYYYDGKGGRKELQLTEGWNGQDQSWMYVKDGKALTGLQNIDGVDYLFNEAGILNYNSWVDDYGYWRRGYVKSDGTVAKGWMQLGNDWYYFDSYGHSVYGVVNVDGKNSYFSNDGRWVGYL